LLRKNGTYSIVFAGHDVEREYIRQTLGSVAIALMDKHQG
jgi:hypothetical protein